MFARGAGRWIAVSSLVPIAVGGYSAVVGLPHPVTVTFLAVLVPVAVALFFRDPNREPDDEGVVSPADGRVTVLRTEEGDDGDEHVRLGVFMNVYDVHVNRFPVGGTVEAVERYEGGYKPAFSKESERNERVVTKVRTSDDGTYRVVQIAGAVARRITTYPDEGEEASRGDRLGLIAFGSRADIIFPSRYELEDVTVEEGDRVRAGETVVACASDEQ